VYWPGAAVCRRTLVRSNGCPASRVLGELCACRRRAKVEREARPRCTPHSWLEGDEEGESDSPTRTAATPPAPPEMKLLRADELFSATFSSLVLITSGLLVVEDCGRVGVSQSRSWCARGTDSERELGAPCCESAVAAGCCGRRARGGGRGRRGGAAPADDARQNEAIRVPAKSATSSRLPWRCNRQYKLALRYQREWQYSAPVRFARRARLAPLAHGAAAHARLAGLRDSSEPRRTVSRRAGSNGDGDSESSELAVRTQLADPARTTTSRQELSIVARSRGAERDQGRLLEEKEDSRASASGEGRAARPVRPFLADFALAAHFLTARRHEQTQRARDGENQAKPRPSLQKPSCFPTSAPSRSLEPPLLHLARSQPHRRLPPLTSDSGPTSRRRRRARADP